MPHIFHLLYFAVKKSTKSSFVNARKNPLAKNKKKWRCHLIIALCSHFTLHTHTQNIFINEKVMHRMNEEEYIKAKMADKYLNKYVFFVWCNY